MNFLKAFIEDMKYYDPERKELKKIIGSVPFKEKIVVDIGAGYGRLAFPICKNAKKVVALDKDKRFGQYYQKHKRKNLEFIGESAEKYLQNKKFDAVILAWPALNAGLIKKIKKAMHKDSYFIFTACDANSDYETIIDKIGVYGKDHFKKDIENKRKFIKKLQKDFKLIEKQAIKTTVEFPDKYVALRTIKNSLKLWFKVAFNEKNLEKLKNIIECHLEGKRVIFKEEVFFYLLKIK